MTWSRAAIEASIVARRLHAKGKKQTPMGKAPKFLNTNLPRDVQQYSAHNRGIGIGDLAFHPRLGTVRVQGWRMQKGKDGVPFGMPFPMAGGKIDRMYVARVDSGRVTVGPRLPVVPNKLFRQSEYSSIMYPPRRKTVKGKK